MKRVRARVTFDIPSEYDPTGSSTASDDELVCHVLMVAARLGIAIKIDDEDPTKFKRVGHVCIQERSWYDDRSDTKDDEELSITSFPDVQLITLV
jgi:hypothetical protein